MTEERTTRVEQPSGNVHTHTTVIKDGNRSRRNWPVVLIVLVLATVAVWVFFSMSGAQVNRDNAIADAAGEVGAAADQVGDAAENAARNVGN